MRPRGHLAFLHLMSAEELGAASASAPQPQRILGSKKGYYKVSFVPRRDSRASAPPSDVIPEPEWMPKDQVPADLVATWRALRTERASFKEEIQKEAQKRIDEDILATEALDEGPQPVEAPEGVADEMANVPPAGESVDVSMSDTRDADVSAVSALMEQPESNNDGAVDASNIPREDDTAPPGPQEHQTPRKEGILTSAVAAIRARFHPTSSPSEQQGRESGSAPPSEYAPSRRVRRPVDGGSEFRPQGDSIESVTQDAQAFIQRLLHEKEQMREELGFVRKLYQEASSSAVDNTTQLEEARKEIVMLKGQLKDGLALQQQFVQAQKQQWEDEAAQLRAQLALFQGQQARTDAEIRRKAAEWDMHLERERIEAEQRAKAWAKWDERRKRDGLFYAGEAQPAEALAALEPIVSAPAPVSSIPIPDTITDELAELAAEAQEAGLEDTLPQPRSRRRRARPDPEDPSKRPRVEDNVPTPPAAVSEPLVTDPITTVPTEVPMPPFP